jgi:hypothetical protein
MLLLLSWCWTRLLDAWFSTPYDVLYYVQWKLGADAATLEAAQEELTAATAAQEKFLEEPVTSLYHSTEASWIDMGSSSGRPKVRDVDCLPCPGLLMSF